MKFISFDKLTPENLKLAASVNSHMIICPGCRKKVSDIQSTLENMIDYVPGDIGDLSSFSLDADIQSEISKFYG